MRRTDTFDEAEVLDGKTRFGKVDVKPIDWSLLGPRGLAWVSELQYAAKGKATRANMTKGH